ncbi:UNVERIFIED_CONTAM: BTB/POZ domain-containing protein [Sesamum calycinum]|uniref:BTB/POZ domain-containing protein n=1 Tax=Sesamum calycinum TaxID=2727403 RepID=A0AAW2PU52_9LAMI
MLDQATLDDLLVSGRNGGVYDVNLVVRLIRLFVHYYDKVSLEKMKKVGELIDMYLGEIGPDPNLKISKFLGVAESLPDCARDSFDQVYRAIDIYLQSHPCLSLEERSRLCRCLNYEKLSLEACKDLAKNPRIPPRIAVQALSSQHSIIQAAEFVSEDHSSLSSNSYKCINTSSNNNNYQMVLYENNDNSTNLEMESSTDDKEDVKKLGENAVEVVELEKVCREMKGQWQEWVGLKRSKLRSLRQSIEGPIETWTKYCSVFRRQETLLSLGRYDWDFSSDNKRLVLELEES